jgi:hypothetical protein
MSGWEAAIIPAAMGAAGGIASSAKGPGPSPIAGHQGAAGGFQPTALRFSDVMGGPSTPMPMPLQTPGRGDAPGTDEGLRLAMLLSQLGMG